MKQEQIHTDQSPRINGHLGTRDGSRPRQDIRTLADLMPGLRAWDAEFSEIEPVSVDRISLEGGRLIFDKNSIAIDRDCRLRLLAQAGAPSPYLANRSIDIQTLVF